ncbi:MAG: LysM peptidoglycan-binding domain-containing protein [Verrucomicrobiota bacterium]|nr:LysM peptidoglycan-binding domain-containing protein [Verrucomicrobiota bacterium]
MTLIKNWYGIISMKIAKIFGIVLALHVLVIGILLVQPGCQTSPKGSASTPAAPDSTSTATDSTGTVHSDFNAGVQAGEPPARTSPTRPGGVSTPLATGDSFNAGVVEEPMITEPVGTTDVATTTYKVEKGDNISKIAKKYGVSNNSIYDANNLNKDSKLKIGQEIIIPASGKLPTASESPAVVVQATSGAEYVVKGGDNLSKIAKANGVTVAAIKEANNLKSDTLKVNQKLIIPGAKSGAVAPAKSSGAKSASAVKSTSATGPTYTVVSGDTLDKIAKKHGVTSQSIKTANAIADARKLKVGQILVIPGGKATAVVLPPASVVVQSKSVTEPAAPAPVAPTTTADAGVNLEQLENLQTSPENEVPMVPVEETATPAE